MCHVTDGTSDTGCGSAFGRACQINDVWVAEDLLVYVTDRVNGGVYILEPEEALAARLREARI